jgi:hypothetical protein
LGEGGYGWIAYSSNRIGRQTASIKAAGTAYPFTAVLALKQQLRLRPVPPLRPVAMCAVAGDESLTAAARRSLCLQVALLQDEVNARPDSASAR